MRWCTGGDPRGEIQQTAGVADQRKGNRHKRRRFEYTTKSRVEYWTIKFNCGVARDRAGNEESKLKGWVRLIVWECKVRRPERLKARFGRALTRFARKPPR
jgi:G:T-mismatch repair DNA endonuclease (very short patch repair protein)